LQRLEKPLAIGANLAILDASPTNTMRDIDIDESQPMKFLSQSVGRACDAWLATRGMKRESWNVEAAREKEKRGAYKPREIKEPSEEVRFCGECGSRFVVMMKTQKFCRSSCKMAAYRKSRKKP
jgi:NADH pyrophosphatase NudC (nudix superfamily)